MSTHKIPNRCWMAVVSLVVLMFIGIGCGPSEFQKHLYQRMDDTKKKHKAVDIQAALVPYFSDERMLTKPLPIEITSLPIFADDPVDVRITSMTTNNSVLMVFVGGGFGHWGIVVARPGHDSEISRKLRKRLTPWEDGVYFYDGE